MTIQKELGKIKNISFGFGGYDDAMIGLTIDLGGENWSTGDFNGAWAYEKVPDHAEWTEESRKLRLGETVLYLGSLLRAAKVKDVYKLIGVPVEATFHDGRLDSWRILTEVL